MEVSGTGSPTAEHHSLQVQRPALRVGDGQVHDPVELPLQVSVGAEDLHGHVQGPGAGEEDVVEEWQVSLLGELLVEGFPVSE